jgi:hypothetical protein
MPGGVRAANVRPQDVAGLEPAGRLAGASRIDEPAGGRDVLSRTSLDSPESDALAGADLAAARQRDVFEGLELGTRKGNLEGGRIRRIAHRRICESEPAWIDGPSRVEIETPGVWTIVYEAEAPGIAAGGSVHLRIPTTVGWSLPHLRSATVGGFIAVGTTAAGAGS